MRFCIAVVLFACGSPSSATTTTPVAPSSTASTAPSPSTSASAAIPTVAPAAWVSVMKCTGFMYVRGIVYDAARDRYLVSSIQADTPAMIDYADGWISDVAPDGHMTNAHWLTGGEHGVTLNAPKGMAIVGDVLWVADNKVVRKFDLATGAARGVIAIPKATSLDGMSAGPGSIFVVDEGLKPMNYGMGAGRGAEMESPSGADAVYEIDKADKVHVIAHGEALHHPHAIAWTSRGLVIAHPMIAWLESGAPRDVSTTPAYGLVAAGDDAIASTGHAIVTVGHDATEPLFVADGTSLGWDAKRRRLIINHGIDIEAYEHR